jgi:hypothetical protein
MKTFILVSCILSAGVIASASFAESDITLVSSKIALVVAWDAVFGVLFIAHADYRYPQTRKRAGQTAERRPVLFTRSESIIPAFNWVGKKGV